MVTRVFANNMRKEVGRAVSGTLGLRGGER